MSSSSFANQKDLKFRITLAQTTFANGSNQVTFNGFRATVDVTMAGWHTNGSAVMRIWGLSQSLMNAVTTLTWAPLSINEKNIVEVWAVDGGVETLVFKGDIVNAWGDYSGMPDVCLFIQTSTCYNLQVQPALPTSYNDAISVEVVLRQLADKMGLILEVTPTISKMTIDRPYLQGSLIDQLRQLINATDLRYSLTADILSAYTKDEYRSGGTFAPVINPDTGLMGYPIFDNNGVNFKCYYNPAIANGGAIKVESSVTRASGTFAVTAIDYHLSSLMPGGPWFMEVICTNVGLVPR